MFKKIIAMLLVGICIMVSISGAFADDYAYVQTSETGNQQTGFPNTDIAFSGSGTRGGVFYAYSYGNAEIEFEQTKGTCSLLSYTKLFSGISGTAEEWGKYQIQVHRVGDSRYTSYDWDDTYFNGSKTIKLSQSGVYYIYVRPYTDSEISDSYLMDQFYGWSNPPVWWIDSYSNCNIYLQYPGTACR